MGNAWKFTGKQPQARIEISMIEEKQATGKKQKIFYICDNGAGFDMTYERVESAEAMIEVLERQTWDVITSDHSMPHFSTPDALRLLKKKGLDIPFIDHSSTSREDRWFRISFRPIRSRDSPGSEDSGGPKEEQDVLNGYRFGANNYIRKPVDIGKFIDAVKQLGLYWLVINEPPPSIR